MRAEWLTTLPVLPLARCVPVVAVHDTHPGRDFRATCLHTAEGMWCVHDGSTTSLVAERHLRVDLDHPLGFTYAVRHLATLQPIGTMESGVPEGTTTYDRIRDIAMGRIRRPRMVDQLVLAALLRQAVRR